MEVKDKKKRKSVSKGQRIAKVKRVLSSFVPWNGSSIKVTRAVMVGEMFDGVAVLYLGKGKWTWTGRGNLNGVIGGYNNCVPKVVFALVGLRLLTRADAGAFCDWFRKKEDECAKSSDLFRASRIANEQGYKLVKKNKAA